MSTELGAVIRAEIAAAGPITFARFMELALYDPLLGYYVSRAPRPTREGDFLTAPELHPIFGHALARQLDEIWGRLGQPDPAVLIEYGAGSGALAGAIFDGLHASGSGLAEVLAYLPVEVNPHRLADLGRVAEAGGWSGRIVANESAGTAPVISILANEFLDALPVHRVAWSDSRLHEIYVRVDATGLFSETIGEPSSPEVAIAAAERFGAGGHMPRDGQRFEVCLALDAWVGDVAARLGSGVLLVIDYGHSAADLYAPSRTGGTVRSYARHDVSGDPYQDVGERDITAHVDLTALNRLATAAGLAAIGDTTQAAFLLGCGLEGLLGAAREDPDLTLPGYLDLRSSIRRLLDPRGLGGFRVVGFSSGLPAEPPLRGFSTAAEGG